MSPMDFTFLGSALDDPAVVQVRRFVTGAEFFHRVQFAQHVGDRMAGKNPEFASYQVAASKERALRTRVVQFTSGPRLMDSHRLGRPTLLAALATFQRSIRKDGTNGSNGHNAYNKL